MYGCDNYDNAVYGDLLSILEEEDMPTQHFREYLATEIARNHFNPVKQWIESDPWDGQDRIRPLCNTIKSEHPLKNILMGKWFLSAVAAACHNPRVKEFRAEGILVLQGAQGIGKTRWINRLAPDWILTGAALDPNNKDSVSRVISNWIVELGELDGTLRKEIAAIKSFSTEGKDKFRLPYAAQMSEFPRRTVFAASVNETEFLVDHTGNRRFWVIPATKVIYDHDINMQQVFAQVYTRYILNEQWWLTDDEKLKLSQLNEEHMRRDEVHDLIRSCISWETLNLDYCDWLTPTEVLISRCKIDHPTKSQRNSAAYELRKLTGLEKGRRKHGTFATWPIPRPLRP